MEKFRELAREEISAGDIDKNGSLNKEEFFNKEKSDFLRTYGLEMTPEIEAQMDKMLQDQFKYIDVDGTGTLDDKEYAAYLMGADAYDGKIDGKLESDAMSVYTSTVPTFYSMTEDEKAEMVEYAVTQGEDAEFTKNYATFIQKESKIIRMKNYLNVVDYYKQDEKAAAIKEQAKIQEQQANLASQNNDISQQTDKTDYVIKSGDTLRKIVMKHYGFKENENDKIRAKIYEVAANNGIANPDLIIAGKTLKL